MPNMIPPFKGNVFQSLTEGSKKVVKEVANSPAMKEELLKFKNLLQEGKNVAIDVIKSPTVQAETPKAIVCGYVAQVHDTTSAIATKFAADAVEIGTKKLTSKSESAAKSLNEFVTSKNISNLNIFKVVTETVKKFLQKS
ncbi:MAG: hypothetical protein A2287_09325 [Candidatus Melainabacteria bacterium RIFOXYA12_FULL_32_12]|nr:MAG: hypothetical protein A2287_09325 [Candidatus Melainabacteria bacterium RIFOXYA12_FULL_32_12]